MELQVRFVIVGVSRGLYYFNPHFEGLQFIPVTLWPADIAKRFESLETALAAEQLRVAALEKEALRALALRLLPPVPLAPLSSPEGSTRSSQSSSASAAQQAAYHQAQRDESALQRELKIAAVNFYGLWDGPHGDGDVWRVRTMIPAAGSILFSDCTAAHIYPRKSPFSADLAGELSLPDDFMTDPRGLLLLPKSVEQAYDRQGIVLAPALGRITLWPAFVGRLSAAELADVTPFFGTVLSWPSMALAEPHYPYMRLLAWACLAVLHEGPPADPRRPALDVIEGEKKSASPTADGNECVTRLSGGRDLDLSMPRAAP